MATKLTVEEVRALNGLTDDQRTGLLAQLTEVENANVEIQKLRKAQPTESQKVVETADWSNMEKAVRDRDAKVKELETLVSTLQLPKSTISGPFDFIFDLFRE